MKWHKDENDLDDYITGYSRGMMDCFIICSGMFAVGLAMAGLLYWYGWRIV
jgi:hypothetical protein